ncbi:MAG: histidine phosphatase family protein [Gemmatimonadetes bacterium]|nr:histidine phosphatase family protein [Gemmatimonadota bacterium]
MKIGARSRVRAAVAATIAVAALGPASSEAHGQEATDEAVVVYLARHAERADDSRDPPLSPEGVARVEALLHVLTDAGLTQVHTTDLRRTRQTADPLAKAHDAPLAVYDPFALAAFAELLKATPGRHFVSGHSNTTPALVRALGGDPHGEIAEDEYDRLYVVVIVPGAEPVTTLLRFGLSGP